MLTPAGSTARLQGHREPPACPIPTNSSSSVSQTVAMQQRSLYRLVCDGWSLTLSLTHTVEHRPRWACCSLHNCSRQPSRTNTTTAAVLASSNKHGGICVRSPSLTTNKPTQTHKPTNHKPAPTTRSHPMTKHSSKLHCSQPHTIFMLSSQGATHTERDTAASEESQRRTTACSAGAATTNNKKIWGPNIGVVCSCGTLPCCCCWLARGGRLGSTALAHTRSFCLQAAADCSSCTGNPFSVCVISHIVCGGWGAGQARKQKAGSAQSTGSTNQHSKTHLEGGTTKNDPNNNSTWCNSLARAISLVVCRPASQPASQQRRSTHTHTICDVVVDRHTHATHMHVQPY